MQHLDAYSPDYSTARERFRAMCRGRGCSVSSYPIQVSGFSPDTLTIESARIGSTHADRLLMISSGLHGSEGPFGSAVQLGWLESLPSLWEPPAGVAVVLLHALNPFGYHMGRRWNEENVDLNRNFLEPDEFDSCRQATVNSLYPKLDPYLNPPSPQGWIDWLPLSAAWFVARYGKKAILEVLPAGQYANPKGLFFGGDRPSQTAEVVSRHASDWVGSATTILHLDFHTGLGARGDYKLLLDSLPGAPLDQWARSWFGDSVETPDGPTAYPIRGGLERWLVRRFADRRFLTLTPEFGTYSGNYVLKMLRRENRAWHWGDRDSEGYRQINTQLRETFVPTAADWRTKVMHSALDVIATAIERLREPH